MRRLGESFHVNKQHEFCCQPTRATANLMGLGFGSRNVRDEQAAPACALMLNPGTLRAGCWTSYTRMRLTQSLQTLARVYAKSLQTGPLPRPDTVPSFMMATAFIWHLPCAE